MSGALARGLLRLLALSAMLSIALSAMLSIALPTTATAADDPVWGQYIDHVDDPPAQAAPALLTLAAAHPDHPLSAEILWDAARLTLDHLHDAAAARPILRRLIARHPESVAADRARARLRWLDAQGPAADSILSLQTGAPALDAWLADPTRADHPLAPALAVRAAALEKGPAALDRLAPYRDHPQWGWLVQRELARRLFYEGRYVDALQRAPDDDPAGQLRALRMIVWRAAAVVLVALIAGLSWLALRRRRRRLRQSRSRAAG